MQNRTANTRDGRGESGWPPKMQHKARKRVKKTTECIQNRTANARDGRDESGWLPKV